MNCELKFLRNPNAVVYAGGLLEATVEINISECVRINAISSKFVGYAKTEWTVDISRYNLQSFTGRVDYLDHRLQILDENDGLELAAGIHNFDFHYRLPRNLPTSYKSKAGTIKYKVQVVVNFSSLTHSELFFELPFVVIHAIDLNVRVPSVLEPVRVELAKNFNFNFASSDVNLMVVVPQGGYVAGQTIDVMVQVENTSRMRVKYVKIKLRKKICYNCTTPKPLVKNVTEVVVKETIYSEIPPKSKRDFLRTIGVPPVPPNIENCEIIRVTYDLKVKAKTIGWNKSPALKIPVVIGTTAIVNEMAITGDASAKPPSYEESFRNAAATDTSSDEDETNM